MASRKVRFYEVVYVRIDGVAWFLPASSPDRPRASDEPQKSASTQRNPFESVSQPPESSPPKISGPTIGTIEFRGARRVSQSSLRAVIESRVGSAYDRETLRRDAQALYNTGRFSNIRWESEPGPAGAIVRFVVVERPLIQSIEYQGDDTVAISEVLERLKQRKVKLGVETLYIEDQLGRAAVTVQELVAERGLENITVTPLVKPVGPSTVKITFRVEEN